MGPIISLPDMEMKDEILYEILGRDLVVTSFITDVKHPVFKQFSDSKPEDEPVAVFVTVQYQYLYD